MRDVEPGDLAPFVAVAHHRSFSRAAVDLGTSASAISHAVRALETRLGLRLFNRTTRSVALTEAGERLYRRVQPAFQDVSQALRELDAFRATPTGTLRLNGSSVAVRTILAPIVARFLAAYPRVQVELVADPSLGDVVAGGFDAGVRFGERIAADMIAIPIGPPQRSAVVGSPDYFTRWPKPRTPEDLKGLPCIRYRFQSGAYYAWEFEAGGVETAVEVAGPMTLGDQDLMLEPALAGLGLAYLFEAQVADLMAAGRLVRVLEDWCPEYPGFHLYYPSRRQLPPAMQRFVEFVSSDRRTRNS
ncbi:MAG: LysR family transcriptional regulator [Phenylobacterium sp.]